MKTIPRTLILAVGLCYYTSSANAAIFLNLIENNNTITVTLSGSFNPTSSPTPFGAHPSGGPDVINPNTPFIALDGASGSTPSANSFIGFGGTELGSIGSGATDLSVDNYTGDFFGLIGTNGGFLLLDPGYVFGSALAGSGNISGTFSSTGLTPGTYTANFEDAVTIHIGNSAIPEPSSALLLGLGSLGFVLRRSRR